MRAKNVAAALVFVSGLAVGQDTPRDRGILDHPQAIDECLYKVNGYIGADNWCHSKLEKIAHPNTFMPDITAKVLAERRRKTQPTQQTQKEQGR